MSVFGPDDSPTAVANDSRHRNCRHANRERIARGDSALPDL